MTLTVTLSEQEIIEAIRLYLKDKGYSLVTNISLSYYPGFANDPREHSYHKATATVEKENPNQKVSYGSVVI